jgi:hypothetical protein
MDGDKKERNLGRFITKISDKQIIQGQIKWLNQYRTEPH